MLSWLNTGSCERVGLIFADGSAVELSNISLQPEAYFSVAPEDMMKYGDKAVATWHTHPHGPARLSVEDYAGFQGWPHCLHIIIGKDCTRGYVVRNGAVLNDEGQDHPAWSAARDMAARLRV